MNEEQSTPTSAPKKKNNKLVIGLVAVVVLIAAAYFIKNNPRGDTSEAVAVVNGVEISRNTLTSSVAQAQGTQTEGADPTELEQQVLDSLIAEELLLQEAQAAGVTANEEQVQQQYDQLTGQFESEEAFQTELAAAQMTEEELREAMTRGNIIQTYLDGIIPVDSIEVSDEEVQAQLDVVTQQLEGQEGVNLDEIRPIIEQQLQQQKYQEQVTAHIDTLRAQGEVTVLL